MAIRKIIEIDEARCDGCGQCVIACAEGALEIRDGKAKIVKEAYCDGLGACIGDCPQEALTIIAKEAQAFDESAMEEHLESLKEKQTEDAPGQFELGCPGAKILRIQEERPKEATHEAGVPASALRNWPIQIHLLPQTAPFFKGAHLLIAADCLPFAMGGFHERLLSGKTLAVGCPKLDDTRAYVDKLTHIFAENEIQSVTIGYMEVPCCAGLVHLVKKALEASGKTIPLHNVKVSVQGEVLDEGENGQNRIKIQS